MPSPKKEPQPLAGLGFFSSVLTYRGSGSKASNGAGQTGWLGMFVADRSASKVVIVVPIPPEAGDVTFLTRSSVLLYKNAITRRGLVTLKSPAEAPSTAAVNGLLAFCC